MADGLINIQGSTNVGQCVDTINDNFEYLVGKTPAGEDILEQAKAYTNFRADAISASTNEALQARVMKETGKGLFREGDKVMQIRNNYQLEWEIRGKYGIAVDKGVGVFNGDMCIIEEINSFAETLTVVFEENRYVEYSFKQLDELELAYAVTIHKSQGSEYPAVILPLLGGPRMLMSRNLLYTAVTRARTCVTILGSEVTFDEMIRYKQEKERYTSLCQRIEEMNEQ